MTARPSFYREIHKAIRSFLLDLVVRAGRVDWNDADAVAAFGREAEVIFELMLAHGHHEEEFVTPLLLRAAPEVAKILGSSHEDQDQAIEELRAQLRAIDTASPGAGSAGHAFLLALSRFAGHNLVHMSDEEEIAMTAIWNSVDDATILEAKGRLIASVPPSEMAEVLRWMLPALNRFEREAMENARKEAQHA